MTATDDDRAWLVAALRDVPDFPKPGIVFKDLTPIFRQPEVLRRVVECFRERWADERLDLIAGIEARGFVIGAALAYAMERPFHLVRKKGKLPPPVVRQEYELEYGRDTIEMHAGTIAPGARVLLVDDLLATGGTLRAARDLVTRLGGVVAGAAVVVELGFLPGRARLGDCPFQALVTVDGD